MWIAIVVIVGVVLGAVFLEALHHDLAEIRETDRLLGGGKK